MAYIPSFLGGYGATSGSPLKKTDQPKKNFGGEQMLMASLLSLSDHSYQLETAGEVKRKPDPETIMEVTNAQAPLIIEKPRHRARRGDDDVSHADIIDFLSSLQQRREGGAMQLGGL